MLEERLHPDNDSSECRRSAAPRNVSPTFSLKSPNAARIKFGGTRTWCSSPLAVEYTDAELIVDGRWDKCVGNSDELDVFNPIGFVSGCVWATRPADASSLGSDGWSSKAGTGDGAASGDSTTLLWTCEGGGALGAFLFAPPLALGPEISCAANFTFLFKGRVVKMGRYVFVPDLDAVALCSVLLFVLRSAS